MFGLRGPFTLGKGGHRCFSWLHGYRSSHRYWKRNHQKTDGIVSGREGSTLLLRRVPIAMAKSARGNEILKSQYLYYGIWVIGHSLGGAIASLASTQLVHDYPEWQKQVHLYTFGMPRVGDYYYAFRHDKLVKNSWRVVNSNNAVPRLPWRRTYPFANCNNGPNHHGIEFFLPQWCVKCILWLRNMPRSRESGR